MFCFEYGTRLDRFDYENLGISKIWYLTDTIRMLISFEMEINGYFDEINAETIYDKLYTKYQNFLCNCLYEFKFPYKRALHQDCAVKSGVIEFDLDRANFKQSDFISYLTANNELNIDIINLKKIMSSEKANGLDIATNQPKNTWHIITKEDIQRSNLLLLYANNTEEDSQTIMNNHFLFTDEQSNECIDVSVQKSDKYIFKKTDKVWNLQYGNAVLVGVKDWLGMTYIKTLLENPGVKIGVLDLQRLAGESDNGGQQNYEQGDYGDEDDDNASSVVSAWETLDSTAKGSYLNRLEVIAVEIKNARNAGNQTIVAALTEEAVFIRKELQQGSFKPKDPEIDKNRKRVFKSIKDTIANIRKLEVLCNYNDKPISSHLTRFIKTGINCSYNVDSDNFPGWRF